MEEVSLNFGFNLLVYVVSMYVCLPVRPFVYLFVCLFVCLLAHTHTYTHL